MSTFKDKGKTHVSRGRRELEYSLMSKILLWHSPYQMIFHHDINKSSFTKKYTAATVVFKTSLILMSQNVSDDSDCPPYSGVYFLVQLRYFSSFQL